MMMPAMDDTWAAYGEDMQQWGTDFNTQQGFADYSWWDPSLDPTACSYGQGLEFEVGFEGWSGYDGSEDWSRRAPKFPPPHAPAPSVMEGMAMLHQAALESQALSMAAAFHQAAQFDMEMKAAQLPRKRPTKAKGMVAPPGLQASSSKSASVESELPRPKPLGLASMMDLSHEAKEPIICSITPATTAPATPASSLSEFESLAALPTSPPTLGSAQEHETDVGAGYSLFGSAPWSALQLGAGSQARPKPEDPSLPVKVLGAALPLPIGAAPAKVKLEELLCREDVCKADGDSPTGLRGPPGLFPPGNLLAGPPGLNMEDPVLNYKMTKRPPGLEGLASVAELPEEALLSSTHAVSSRVPPEDKALESVTVEDTEIDADGVSRTRAVWRIVQLRSRLKTSLGKPVVSPPFTICGLGDLRLMVTPDAKGTLEGMRGKSKQSHFAKMLSQGPLECTLKVKVPCTSTPVVKFYLTVGPHCRQGPFTCDCTQHTVHGCNDFDCDWLKQVDEEGCLCVGLEIVEVCTDGQRPP